MNPRGPRNLHFGNTKDFQIFFKNRPKHLGKLNIHCALLNPRSPNKKTEILQNLIKMSKKAKSTTKSLQYINLSKNLGAKPGQLRLFVKKFYRVKSLGLFWDFYDVEIQRETSKWLKYAKDLRSIFFKNAVYKQGIHRVLKEPEKTILQRLENMKRTKIMKVVHSDSCRQFKKVQIFPFYMDKYPSTLEELSIRLEDSFTAIESYQKQVSMHKFACLRKLELLFPLDLKTAWMILQTIPNPQLLSCLGFSLKVLFGEFDREIMPILNFIMNCQVLEKLSLQINYQNPRLKALRLPPGNNLKILNFEIWVSCDRHLQEIGAFLLTANELESLDLRVNLNGYCQKFSVFNESLGKLIRLKKLCLKMKTNYFVENQKMFLELIKSIACLDKLEEICVCVPDLLRKEFFEVLDRIGGQLKKIKLDFFRKDLDEKDPFGFLDLLRKMKMLEDLRIERLSIGDLESLLKFKQVLGEMESLKKIYWKNFVIPGEGLEALFEIIMSLLEKKGVKELVIHHSHQWSVPKIYKDIAFEEALKKNPWLNFAKIESQMVRDGLFSRNFDTCREI